MPELPPFVWLAIILFSIGATAVDSVHNKWHYRNRPQLGCHMVGTPVTGTTALCYFDERNSRLSP